MRIRKSVLASVLMRYLRRKEHAEVSSEFSPKFRRVSQQITFEVRCSKARYLFQVELSDTGISISNQTWLLFPLWENNNLIIAHEINFMIVKHFSYYYDWVSNFSLLELSATWSILLSCFKKFRNNFQVFIFYNRRATFFLHLQVNK